MTNQPLGCIWENRESLILRHPWAVDTAARIVPPHPRFCWPTKETWQSPRCSKKRTDRCSHRKKARKDPKCVSRFPERIYTSSLARVPAVRPCLCELPLPQQAQFSEDRTKCLTSDQPCLKHSFKQAKEAHGQLWPHWPVVPKMQWLHALPECSEGLWNTITATGCILNISLKVSNPIGINSIRGLVVAGSRMYRLFWF